MGADRGSLEETVRIISGGCTLMDVDHNSLCAYYAIGTVSTFVKHVNQRCIEGVVRFH